MNTKIKTREEFINFVERLRADFLTNKDDWENQNLADFLEALARYAEDIDGYYANTNPTIDADQPSWQVFADMLAGAKIYE